ncbi:MAG: ATP-binding cassette domain-containing protein [Chloroflexi bacterium]|nr:ATP-binding cassette domain-containing protein [Chloroflexota bacterium]
MTNDCDGRQVLHATALTKVFGEGESEVRAVDGVDLQVCAGEMLLIMGPSGSGKTTLLTMLGGLLRPTSGTIEVDGVDITALKESQLTPVRRKRVGFIFQSFNLWESLSVQENIELTLNMAGAGGRAARDRARALLEQQGLGHRLKFRSRNLSGGEKQRVSIARALANEPRLLLADEPTANLDSKHGRDVMHLLRDLSRSGERAVIVVSHDQRIREVADRVLWLEDGRVKDIGQVVRDPVCGASVETDNSVPLDHDGQTYYFCSRDCRRTFQQSPARFTSGTNASFAAR